MARPPDSLPPFPSFSRDEPTTSQTGMHSLPVGPAEERPVLSILTGLSAGRVFPLEQDTIIIGRSQDCHIALADPGVSRVHAKITRPVIGPLTIEDAGSTNGTFLNGAKIERAEIRPADRFNIGPHVVMRFSYSDRTEAALASALYESATIDGLTRTYTRRYFADRFKSEFVYALRHKTDLGLILFDIDHFKKVNDEHGHLAGDLVLKHAARHIQSTIRGEDLLARYGGEEFVVLVRGIDRIGMVAFAERLRAAIERAMFTWETKVLPISISLGVASLTDKPATSETELLALADERLYRAKREGRNRVCSE